MEFEEKEMGMGERERKREREEIEIEKLSPQREWQKRREKGVGRACLSLFFSELVS